MSLTVTAPDPASLRRALGSFATGVAVVTATADASIVGLTVNSFASLSLDPPLVLWSLNVRSSSLATFRSAPYFAINVLSEDQSLLSVHFATPRKNRFEGVVFEAGLGGAPLLANCVAHFECAVVDLLGEEVLASLPEETREFLLRTSMLRRMTGPFATRLRLGRVRPSSLES